MNYSFCADLSAVVEIDDADFQLLIDRALSHYDSTVEASAKVGGFLYGFQNRREFSNGEDKKLILNQRQLNLMMKSLEMNQTQQSWRISKDLRNIFLHLQKEMESINKKLEFEYIS